MKIEIENATFSYNGKDTVFEDVNFSVKKGEIFFILGPNGTGKSTLLKTMAGLLPLKKGKIKIEGRDVTKLSRENIAKKIGYLPQIHQPTFPFKVLDVVLMGRAPHLSAFSSPGKKDVDIAKEYIHKLGISHLIDKPYTEISGGERQLVLLARVLTQKPDILLLDEPTSHLDFGNQVRILGRIEGLSSQGLAIIITSHFPDNAFFISHKVGIINNKKLANIGHPDDVITEKTLKEIYGIWRLMLLLIIKQNLKIILL